MDRKEKRNKDRFSVTLIGVIVYSIILICVMGGAYVGVKAVFRNAPEVATADEDVAPTSEEIIEQDEEPSIEEPVIEEEPIEEEDTVLNEHKVDVSDVEDKETGYVDYSVTLFEPAKRNKELKWKDSVFARIENVNNPKEALVNTYDIKRITATLVDNKPVQYIAYTNPETLLTEKITELEDCGDGYETIDYYFDKGNINYIAQYKMVIAKPIPLSSGDIGSRFYYKDDVMVRFIYCDQDRATEYSLADIDSYSSGTVEQYDYLEKSMLNRAYIVYNLVADAKETEELYGYVMDEFTTPIEDAEISIVDEIDGSVVAHTRTDGDGFYKVKVECDNDKVYTVEATKESFTGVNVYGITAKAGSLKYAVDPIYMNYANTGMVFNAQIIVRDALDSNKALSGATIKLRRGINNREGDVIAKGELDDVGLATVPMIAGSYTAEVSKGGYEVAYFPVIIRVDHQIAVGFAMPDVADNTYKIITSWDSSPYDIDAKIISSGQGRVIKPSVDSLGSTTAEVITIDEVDSDDYQMYISDYGSLITGDALSYNLTNSNALVTIYNSDGYVSSYHVPLASAGVVWQPFEIHNKQILPINSYYFAIENSPLWLSK